MQKKFEKLSFSILEFPAPAILVNKEGLIVHMNNRAQTLFGDLDSTEYLDHSILDFICEDSIELASADLMNILSTNTAVTREYHVKLPNGESFWIEAIGSRIEVALAYYDLVVFRDISHQKRYQEELTISENKYEDLYSMLRLMCDTVPDMIWAKDVNGKILFANKSFCNKFLLTEDTDEPLGKDEMYFIQRACKEHPNNTNWHTFGEVCMDSDLAVIKSGTPKEFEECGKIKGETVVLNVSKAPMFAPDAKLIGSVGCGRDITDRVKLKQELEAKDARNSAILNAIPDMMFGFLKDGTIVDYKTEQIDDLFISPDRFMGHNVRDVLPRDLAELTLKMIDVVFTTGNTQTYQYSLLLKDKQQHFDSRMTMYGDDKYLAIVRNITEQVESQRELLWAKERAEESDKLKTAFLANLSHEIRTPMNGILGFVDILKDDLPVAEQHGYLDIIADCSNQLLSIITDIIEVSIIEAGQMKVIPAVINLSKMMSDIYKTMQIKASMSPGVEFHMPEMPENGPISIVTDEVKLSQILNNLIINAFKFTLTGSIKWGYRLVSSQELEFYVQDTGIGISLEDQAIIFDRFRQVENYLTRSKKGIGLGLSICKSYIELMGGRIRVESVANQGSTFTFNLPISRPGVQPIAAKPTMPQVKSYADKVVLIAEDDGINYQYQNTVIRKTSASVLHAWNGLEAVEMFESNTKIDLVLMDIKMPTMNGFDATYRIRALNPDVPIVALTAYALEHEKSLALTAGCNEYLTKPISINDLLSIVDKYLGTD